jgi:hypothetical protein
MKRYYVAALIGLFLIPLALLAPTVYEAWKGTQEPPSSYNEIVRPTFLTLYDGGKPVKVWTVGWTGVVAHLEKDVLQFMDGSTDRTVTIYGPAIVAVSGLVELIMRSVRRNRQGTKLLYVLTER